MNDRFLDDKELIERIRELTSVYFNRTQAQTIEELIRRYRRALTQQPPKQ